MLSRILSRRPGRVGTATVGGAADLAAQAAVSLHDAITAHAGGGQASATQLSSGINRVSVVATTADSVKLPASPGPPVTVINDTSNSLQVFGTSPDTINAVATGTGVALAAGKVATYYSTVAGKWRGLLSA